MAKGMDYRRINASKRRKGAFDVHGVYVTWAKAKRPQRAPLDLDEVKKRLLARKADLTHDTHEA